MKNENLSSRIVWADVVRLLAIFMVICAHCADPFNVSPQARLNPDFNFWGTIYGSLLRPCVPLFVMLTGMLILPVRMTTGAFYKKRLTRILWPFLIASVAYNLFPALTGAAGLDASVISKVFPYAGDHPSQSWADSLQQILMIPLNFSMYTTHLWYIYMLIGLYLYLPILSAWLQQASEKSLRLFLLLWGVTLLVPYLTQYATPNLWGTCAWNPYGMLYYFAGFNGYLVAGYYLRHYNRLSGRATAWMAPLLFAAGYAITYLGFSHTSQQPDITEEQLEFFFLYCSPQVVMMTLGLFIALQRIHVSHERLRKALADLTRCGLGIYLIHYVLVGLGYTLIDWLQVPVALRIPVTAVLVLFTAWGIVTAVYRKAPRLARLIFG